MVIEGKLHVKFDTQQVSEKFAKREFVVEYADNPMYPQFIKFECTQDRCAMVDAVREGEKIEVTFNLRGREWINPQGEKKYFTSLEAWRIQKMESAANAPAGNGGQAVYNVADLANDESDDLPF
jgi:hypothetical protein